jgi:diadenosine tetraphosphate (Ap4A) HIT family hydrolase
MVEACRAGVYEPLIGRMSSGWAVLGKSQFLRGYCLLLPDPVAPHLNALVGERRVRFLNDVALLGDAVLKATAALRINYAVFGNLEPALHAHVIPRYEDEPEDKRTAQPWAYDWSAAPQFDLRRDGALLAEIRKHLLHDS